MKTIKNIVSAVMRLKNWDKVIVIISSLITLVFLVIYVVDHFIDEPTMHGVRDNQSSNDLDEFLICAFIFLMMLSVVFNLSRIASSLEEIAKNTKKEIQN